MGPDARQRLAGAALVNAMWWYAGTVLYPTRALRQVGLVGDPPLHGEEPLVPPRPGLGPHFSGLASTPRALDQPTGHEPLVEEFDRMAEVYELFVAPFSRPIFEEALAVLRPWLAEDTRVLDAGCGPGRELRQVARLVPRGEVVGVDLAAGMVAAAARACHAHGLDNTAFVQADVGELPDAFNGSFDLVYSVLAHHHFPAPAAAAAGAFRCLRPGGLYAVIDPGPVWYNRLAAPLASWADPGWIGFTTPEEFDRLLREAGFSRVSWRALLPGFGLALGQKP